MDDVGDDSGCGGANAGDTVQRRAAANVKGWMGGLPRRDLLLLPIIALVTLVALLAGAEQIAQLTWAESEVNTCRMPDAALVFRYKPNCTSTMKAVEGPQYTNQYNECGYRSATSCGPVAAGTRRIALIGSSMSEGHLVEFPNTIAERLRIDLTAACKAPVDLQNLGAINYSGHRLVHRMDEALTLRPNAVLLVIAPFDIDKQLDPDSDPITGLESQSAARPAPAMGGAPLEIPQKGLLKRLSVWLKGHRTVVVAQHFLFRNPSIYLPLYLSYGDNADFLRPPFTAPWTERLRRFDLLMTELSDRARAAGVPLTIAFVPQQAQLTLMATKTLPPGVNPDALPEALAAIATRHGAAFIDTSEAMRNRPDPWLLYYQVDGHPSGEGQPFIAQDIAQHYIDAASGPFTDCRLKPSSRQAAAP